MKINPAASFGVYKTNLTRAPEAHGMQGVRSENTDQLSISTQGARQAEIDRITKTVVSEIKPASPQRIEALRNEVQQKTYHVSTSDLVDAVIEHFGM